MSKAAAHTRLTPAPASIATAAPFRAWRSSQLRAAGGPIQATAGLWS